jgi:5-methylcytosine-specific restriction endonuclease McrA
MSGPHIPSVLRAAVAERAGGCCEYCRVPEAGVLFRHEPDHIVATQHGGLTTLENLALACAHCNRCKGANLSSVDPDSNQVVALFNPRVDGWFDHFRLGRAANNSAHADWPSHRAVAEIQ